MLKITISLNIDMEDIIKGYQNHFGVAKKPTKRDIANWVGMLAEADIIDAASHVEEDDED